MSEKIILTENQKKTLSRFSYSFLGVFYINFVNNAFYSFYIICFGDAKNFQSIKLSPAYEALHRKEWLVFPLMLFIFLLWNKPINKYLKNPTKELQDKIRHRIEHIYYYILFFFLIIFFSIAAAAFFLNPDIGKKYFLTNTLPALLFSFSLMTAITVIYIDSLIYKSGDAMEALYSQNELFQARSGHAIPFYIKISMLISASAIIPFISIFIAILNQVPLFNYREELKTFFAISIFMLMIGLFFIFHGFQKPINILLDKMKKLASGNYDVKSRIYFSDEIGKIKYGFNKMVDGLKEREELYGTFGKYLSIEVAKELVKNKKVNLGGEEIKASVMFCDIRNFTPLSEKMTAQALVIFLNDYFSHITPPIIANKGIISKFMGDGIMAIYAPNLGAESYAKNALKSAIEMRQALTKFNDSGKYPFKVAFGIGLHTGTLIAGNIGTNERMEYTFIGDSVNMASRLESKTKDFKTDIILSENFAEEYIREKGDIQLSPLGETELKGKTKPVKIFKPA